MSSTRNQFSSWCVDGVELFVRHRLESSDDNPEIDPNFFDEDFNVAVATGGLRVWDGSKVLFNFISENYDIFFDQGARIIELGSGSGMLAIAIAMKGAHVLATDVKCVVDDLIRPSIFLNSTQEVPFWCNLVSGVKLGKGIIATGPLDWRKPFPSYLQNAVDLNNFPDIIIASEVVWLKELAVPFFSALVNCLRICSKSNDYGFGLISFPIRGLDIEDVQDDSERVSSRLTEIYCGRKFFERCALENNVKMEIIFNLNSSEKEHEAGLFGTLIYKATLYDE